MSDYIDRKIALSMQEPPKSNRHYQTDNLDDVYGQGWDDALCCLERIPAADVVSVVHGRWISWEEANNFIPSPDRHECSVCHDAAQVLVNGLELLSDYCPNCGAIMDGDANNEVN